MRREGGDLTSAQSRQLTIALLLALLLHAPLLSLSLGGQGFGLPGVAFPWSDRRSELPERRVVLVRTPVTAPEPAVASIAKPLSRASSEQPRSGRQVLTPPAPPAPSLPRTADAIVPEATPNAQAVPKSSVATPAADAIAPSRSDGHDPAGPTPISEPAVIALERSREPTVVPPPVPSAPAPVVAAALGASNPVPVLPAPREAGDEARQPVDPQVQGRAVEMASDERSQALAQPQAQQLEAARVEAAQLEAQRREAERQAAIRREAAQQEAARQEATQVESARLEAQRQEAARVQAAQDEAAARREAARRAMGRQLDEEAARREAASTSTRDPGSLPYSWSNARRGRIFGRIDPNAELVRYAEAFARKIQLNMTLDMVGELAKRPHVDPLVTVAIRRDGSVESVTFVVSSGVAEIDEAIRRIVQSQVPYPAFPPGLAGEFDVIDIRRNWYFDMAVRLY